MIPEISGIKIDFHGTEDACDRLTESAEAVRRMTEREFADQTEFIRRIWNCESAERITGREVRLCEKIGEATSGILEIASGIRDRETLLQRIEASCPWS